MDRWVIVLSLLSLMLILGCEDGKIITTNLTAANELDDKQENGNVTVETTNDEESVAPETPRPGDCPGKFICISSIVSAYQDTNCKITNRTTCKTECINGICKEKEIRICLPGFKCRNQQERGFQREDCTWDKKERCDFDCNLDTNKCYNRTANRSTTSTTQITTNITVVKPKDPILVLGQMVEVTGGNLSIYLLEPTRVQLKLNTRRSDWIDEGKNYTFINSSTITIKEILFQAYDGGKKQIVYTIG